MLRTQNWEGARIQDSRSCSQINEEAEEIVAESNLTNVKLNILSPRNC